MSDATTTVLFIHSTGTLPAMWEAVPAEALRGAAALKPANLGYPPNAPLARGTPVSVDDDVRHLAAQLPSAGAVHVVAHSYGGLIALRLAPLIGARLASVLLFEPVLFGALTRSTHADPAVVAEAHAFDAHDWFLTDEARGGSDEWLEIFIDYWNRPGSWARMPEPMKAFTRSVGWKMFEEVRAVFRDGSRFDDHRISAPLTLLEAARSPRASRAMIDELARVNPHATVVDLADTGHLAPLTHPSIFARAVVDHLARVSQGPRL
jgi:pimeloyl-ACP methyl ester carboxylesterase